ncbi:MAG: hypothetical protein GY811_08370 [Myxococcales bacterium]|nr:hypothetical protein [Myxococcales bacterium]
MSAPGKVEVTVLRPANPLAPPPRPTPGTTAGHIDSLLLKLTEWEQEGAEGAQDEKPRSKRGTQRKPVPRSAQERVRNLSMADQQKVARSGELADRVALERLYGKAVWETLLHNPRLTPPEVLRIARMASLPKPLLDLIVNNRGWLSSPQVRRALLANRRLTKNMVATVLRATPKNELKIMHRQTAYPPIVREAAAKLTK